jgi:hypothetical protein
MADWQYTALGWTFTAMFAFLAGAACMRQHLTGRWLPLRDDPHIESNEERDARFVPGNDRIWGPGNWVRCPTCPRDSAGNEVYHHKDAHPTGTPTWEQRRREGLLGGEPPTGTPDTGDDT